MIHQIRNPHFYIVFFTDLVLICLSLYLAYLIRFEFTLYPQDYRQILSLLELMVPIKLAIFFAFKLYKGMFRYASLSEMWRVFKAVVVSSLLIMFIILVMHRFQGYSRGIFIIDAAVTLMLIGGFRLGIRISLQYAKQRKENGNGTRRFSLMPLPKGSTDPHHRGRHHRREDPPGGDGPGKPALPCGRVYRRRSPEAGARDS